MKPEQVRAINFRVGAQPDQQNSVETLARLLHENVGNKTPARGKGEADFAHHRHRMDTGTVQALDGVFNNGFSKYLQRGNGTGRWLRAVSRKRLFALRAQ